MTHKMPAWSFSALSAFETCGLRYFKTRVSKEIVEPQTEATLWGNQVHKAFEDRFKNKAPLPDYMKAYEPLVSKLMLQHGVRLVEEQMAITKNFRPCEWRAKDAWVRAIVDFGIVGPKKALFIDWKTGKRKPDSTQLMLSAAIGFAHYPFLESITTGFFWFKDRKTDKETFTREQLPQLWGEFLPRVQRLEGAYADDKWHPKPSGLCAKWCPVPKSHCEYSGKQ